MGDTLAASIHQIRSHANHVDGVHSKAQTALDAAHQVTPGGFDIAYGLICQFFPPLLSPIEQKGVSTIEAAATKLQKMVDGLRASADSYQKVEDDIEQKLKKILDELGGLEAGAKPTGAAPPSGIPSGAGQRPERMP